MNSPKAYSKAVAAALVGALLYAQAHLPNGITREEVGQAIIAGLLAGIGVYLAPKNQETHRG